MSKRNYIVNLLITTFYRNNLCRYHHKINIMQSSLSKEKKILKSTQDNECIVFNVFKQFLLLSVPSYITFKCFYWQFTIFTNNNNKKKKERKINYCGQIQELYILDNDDIISVIRFRYNRK